MPQPALMHLKILLPSRIFAEKISVSRLVVETSTGWFGILPHRLDCVAALVPGILIYENGTEAEVCLGIDEGVLVKFGNEVLVSVRNAIAGTDLSQLREAVERDFLRRNEQEKDVQRVMDRVESGFLRRFAEFQNV